MENWLYPSKKKHNNFNYLQIFHFRILAHVTSNYMPIKILRGGFYNFLDYQEDENLH